MSTRPTMLAWKVCGLILFACFVYALIGNHATTSEVEQCNRRQPRGCYIDSAGEVRPR